MNKKILGAYRPKNGEFSLAKFLKANCRAVGETLGFANRDVQVLFGNIGQDGSTVRAGTPSRPILTPDKKDAIFGTVKAVLVFNYDHIDCTVNEAPGLGLVPPFLWGEIAKAFRLHAIKSGAVSNTQLIPASVFKTFPLPWVIPALAEKFVQHHWSIRALRQQIDISFVALYASKMTYLDGYENGGVNLPKIACLIRGTNSANWRRLPKIDLNLP